MKVATTVWHLKSSGRVDNSGGKELRTPPGILSVEPNKQKPLHYREFLWEVL